MKKHAMFTVAGCLGLLLGVAGMAQSGPTHRQPVKPDLIPTNIKAVQQGQGKCYLQVTMRNNGPGIIPDTIWAKHRVGVQMYNGNTSWGGMALSYFDHGKRLKNAGGSLSWDWFKSGNLLLQAGKTYTIKVVADSNKELAETNEGNNVLVRRIRCGAPAKYPDVGLYGFLKIGKSKRQVQWNSTITLTPADAHLVSHGHPAFDLYYGYREYAGMPAHSFSNKVYYNGKMVSRQSNLSLQSKEIKHVATQAYFGPAPGKLCVHIDTDNTIQEGNHEANNKGCVNVKFKDFNHKPHVKIPTARVRDIPHKKPNFILPNDKVKNRVAG